MELTVGLLVYRGFYHLCFILLGAYKTKPIYCKLVIRAFGCTVT